MLIIIFIPNLLIFGQEGEKILMPYHKNGKWGYVNDQKEIVVGPIYDEAGLFSIYLGKPNSIYARVKKGEKYGVLNELGELVLPIEYDSIENYSLPTTNGGIGIVYKDDQRYFFDQYGKIKEEGPVDLILECKDGMFDHCVKIRRVEIPEDEGGTLNYQFSCIEKTEGKGQTGLKLDTLKLEVDSIIHIGGSKLIYGKRSKISFCDILGEDEKEKNICSGFIYDEVRLFNCKEIGTNVYEPIAAVKEKNKWGLIKFSTHYLKQLNMSLDRGQIVIEPKYERIIKRIDNIFLVEFDQGEYGYVKIGKGDYMEYW